MASGPGRDAIKFAELHPGFTVTGIERSRIAVQEANIRLSLAIPDVQRRVNFIASDVTLINPRLADAPAPLVYNLFPHPGDLIGVGGSTTRFADDGGIIYILTENDAWSGRLDDLLGNMNVNLRKRGLYVGEPEIVRVSDAALRNGEWPLQIPIISSYPNYENWLLVFQVGCR